MGIDDFLWILLVGVMWRDHCRTCGMLLSLNRCPLHHHQSR
jgi:hypothetical protein